MSAIRGNNRSLAALFWETLSERQTLILALISVGIAIVAHLVTKEIQYPAWAFWYLTIFFVASFWTLIAAAKAALKDGNATPFPRVSLVVSQKEEECILLLEASDLFGMSTLVTIFHKNQSNGFEVMIGHGMVQAVQTDLRVQIKIDEWIDGNTDIISKVRLSSPDVLEQLVVRPSVARSNPWIKEAQVRMWAADSVRQEIIGALGAADERERDINDQS